MYPIILKLQENINEHDWEGPRLPAMKYLILIIEKFRKYDSCFQNVNVIIYFNYK